MNQLKAMVKLEQKQCVHLKPARHWTVMVSFYVEILVNFYKISYFLKKWRLEGGIEPLRVSPPTGLKPAHRTTEAHLGGGNSDSGLYILNCDF